MAKNAEKLDMSNFDWVQLKRDIDAPYQADPTKRTEAQLEKLRRKIRENPVVPFGCLLTAGALIYGLISFRKGDSETSQKMMRVRIGAQGFTIAALIAGLVYTTLKDEKKQKSN